ncbi:MAG: hypothetical protein K2K30_02075 [Alistipes sp.]|nr:hypothetical protein [Alistipes sp.]MDE6623164.1 hypothetical protein [Alistipes sp.]
MTDRLNTLPGPLWLFGAYALQRLLKWLHGGIEALVLHLEQGGGFDRHDLAVRGTGLLAAALPLLLGWLLLRRRPAALWLLRWYAGLKALIHLSAIVLPLAAPGAKFPALLPGLLLNLTLGVVWFALLRYLERSERLADYPSAEKVRYGWLFVPLMAAVLICCG